MSIEQIPASWQHEVKRLRSECSGYRVRLREALNRIAELEAVSK